VAKLLIASGLFKDDTLKSSSVKIPCLNLIPNTFTGSFVLINVSEIII